jgi:mannose-1-phosphate guanylyltransferase
MKAMILSAGLGTRLRPVTDVYAKPAVPFLNIPLLYFPVMLLESGGIHDLVINTCYKSEQVEAIARSIPDFKGQVRVSHEPGEPLGSGGGVWKARRLLEDADFFLANGDEVILPRTAGVMKRLRDEHTRLDSIATILVMRDPRVGTQFGGVWADANGVVRGFGKDGKVFGADVTGFHYIGLQIMSPRVFKYLPEGHSNILYDALTAAIAAGETVRVVVDDFTWFETGNPHDFLRAINESLDILARPDSDGGEDTRFLHQTLKRFGLPSGESALADRADTRLITVNVSIGTRVLLGNDAIIQPGAALRGFVVIGDGAEIRAGAIVENSVVLPGTIVDTNQHIVDRIVTPL